MWIFRGTQYYLDVQGDRLGLSRSLTDQSRHNPEVYRVSVLLGQPCERYHRARGEDDFAAVLPAELAQIRGTLGQCERELEKLHALAAAAQAMVDEAHRAFGLEPPGRRFRVACDRDERGSSASA